MVVLLGSCMYCQSTLILLHKTADWSSIYWSQCICTYQLISDYPKIIVVSGSTLLDCTGTYQKCEEKSSHAKNRPVYKLDGENRYIYYYPNSKGWRIGTKDDLNGKKSGQYFFASKIAKDF